MNKQIITTEDVSQAALSARLDISAQDVEKFTKDFNDILSFLEIFYAFNND